MRTNKFTTLRALVVGEAEKNAGTENVEGFNQALVCTGGYKATVFFANQSAAEKRQEQLAPAGIVDITAYVECNVEETRKGFDAVWFNLDNRRITSIVPVVDPTPEDYKAFDRVVYEEKRRPGDWAKRA